MLQNILRTRSVCVFCGAGGKMSEANMHNAFMLGQELAKHGFNLVTGGANVGMMQKVVDGHANNFSPDLTRHGVMHEKFKTFKISHPLIPDNNLAWAHDIHARLKGFYDISDDIVILPGGFGTLHELMDTLVHSQFGDITKRIFLLNTSGYWNSLLEQFKVMVHEGAVPQKHLEHLIVVSTIEAAIERLKSTEEISLSQGIEASRWEPSEISK
jgi:uncharacterized protein (TIGR00730 family)